MNSHSASIAGVHGRVDCCSSACFRTPYKSIRCRTVSSWEGVRGPTTIYSVRSKQVDTPFTFISTKSATLSHNWILSPNLLTHTQFSAMHLLSGLQSEFTGSVADFGVNLVPNGPHISVAIDQTELQFETPYTGNFGRAHQHLTHDWTWNEAPFEIPVSELTGQPKRDLAVTLECAENPVGGGLVSHAEWTGVALADLLGRAGPLREGRFVRLTGKDGFIRSIPLEKATHRDTLLVYRMNREKLPLVHGGPLRALIPGWYGMDSVKWLRKVEVVADGKNDSYLRRTRAGETEPITKMNVKAAFARPVDGAVIFRRSFLARGAAWAGESKVQVVEFSSDGGSSWQTARLLDKAQPYAWVRWEYSWRIASPGDYTLVVRATDDAGDSQPVKLDPARVDEYEQNSRQRVRVTVA